MNLASIRFRWFLPCFIIMSVTWLVHDRLNVKWKMERFAVVEKLFASRLDSVPPVTPNQRVTNITGPIRDFVFHALHKTASETTRNQLRTFCYRENLTCLTYCECGICYKAAKCFARTNADDLVEDGSLTVARMRDAACCKNYETFVRNGLDGVIDHLPLFVSENRDFLEFVVQPNAFRFTILRDPINQFISYHTHLSHRYHKTMNTTLNGTISMFHSVLINRSLSSLPKIYHIFHYQLTNSQSKELGWSGNHWSLESLIPTIEYLRSLDFVGFADDLIETWKQLKARLKCDMPPQLSPSDAKKIGVWLGKSNKYNPQTNTHIQQSVLDRRKLTKLQLQQLRAIQFADVALYNEAKRLWGKK